MRQYICSKGKAESLVIFIKDFPGHQAECMKDEKESYASISFPGEHMVFFSPPCLEVSVGAVTSIAVHLSNITNTETKISFLC